MHDMCTGHASDSFRSKFVPQIKVNITPCAGFVEPLGALGATRRAVGELIGS